MNEGNQILIDKVPQLRAAPGSVCGVKAPSGGGGTINLRQGRPRFDFPAAPPVLWVTVYFTLPLTLILKWETHLLKTRESKRGGGEAGRRGRVGGGGVNE